MNTTDYYNQPIIRHLISQYISTAEYIVGLHESFTYEYGAPYISMKVEDLDSLINNQADIFRSIWDKENLLGVIDMEYVNFNYPGEAFFKPYEVFNKLEFIYQQIKNILTKYNIPTLRIMTGQGYHFVFRIPFESKTFKKLAKIGNLEPTLIGKYNSTTPKRQKPVPIELGLAYDGVSRIIEYLIHRLFKTLKDYIGVPVTCNELETGNRETIALDISMYGDPIYMRDIRCPFSIYRKHKVFRSKFGDATAEVLPILVSIPRNDNLTLNELLSIRTDLKKVSNYAEKISNIEIPDASEGVLKLLKSYMFSKLRRFHKHFDSSSHDPPEIWYRTYDFFDPKILPPCIAHSLIFPNDHLLKLTNIQNISRVLTKLNWHPKHIAGLIRSKYEKDYNWGKVFGKYDAATRANFFVRVFAGLLVTGIDKEDDLNCVSQQHRGYCPGGCKYNLVDYKI